MSMLIEGVDMPRGTNMMLLISPDGDVWEMGDLSGNDKLIEGAKAIPVSPHGRCIDADALKASLAFAEKTAEWAVPALRAVLTVIDEMPTIIPAEEGDA